ncbi:hypothetical protein [Pseudomonas sp.]|uniref:hypothetical protein n=1 Tax=Pseudomonas sp. TaxID=306 RepID=UPI00405449A1
MVGRITTAVYRLTKNQSLARAVANSAAMVMRDDIIDAVKVEKGMIGLEEYALAAHRRCHFQKTTAPINET